MACGGDNDDVDQALAETKLALIKYELARGVLEESEMLPGMTEQLIEFLRENDQFDADQELIDAANQLEGWCAECVRMIDRELGR